MKSLVVDRGLKDKQSVHMLSVTWTTEICVPEVHEVDVVNPFFEHQ
jgi:hypothetical protein